MLESTARCSLLSAALFAAVCGTTLLTPASLLAAEAPAAKTPVAVPKGTALVTGANRGLGLELAKQLREAGYAVIGTARSPAEASDLLATGARVVPLDVTDAKSVAALAKGLEGLAIDILINNAGVMSGIESVGALSFAEVEKVLATNTVGPMRVTQALLPNLRSGKRKLIVSISSRLGSIAGNSNAKFYGYRESKAALNMFMRSIAMELKPEGFICVAMSPGWVRTDMGGSQAPLSPEESVKGMLSVMESLKAEDTGAYRSYDGATLPW